MRLVKLTGVSSGFKCTFPLLDGVEYYSTSGESDLLTTSLASSRMILKGTTDIVVADKPYIDCRNVPSGMRIVIELKKSVEGMSPIVQAAAELLVASAVSNFPVVVLLTDLKNHWQFAWLTKREVIDCTFGCLKGSVLLKILTTGPTTPALEDQVTPPAPYEMRCTLRSIYGYKDSNHKASVLESILNRPKVGLMDILPQGDVGNMAEVFDVMTEAEVADWVRRAAQRYLVNTPAGQSSITTRDDWNSMYV